ncbi:MAG: nucleotidyltransferase domain-containing protein [bacterium]
MDIQVQEELDIIVDKIKCTVKTEKIYLFGSFANGSPREDSDFDIYVLLDKIEERPIKSIQKIYKSLYKLNIRPIDILANYTDIFLKTAEDITLEKNILEKGVIIYERNN